MDINADGYEDLVTYRQEEVYGQYGELDEPDINYELDVYSTAGSFEEFKDEIYLFDYQQVFFITNKGYLAFYTSSRLKVSLRETRSAALRLHSSCGFARHKCLV
ncbi:MAG: hypothetical protein LBS19_14880 [Clostridiales bacterium]|nr:hypothetical protein [Clostridiales bacterium]